ncbi:MAG: hypothetical protein WC606_04265 [Candidatus Absconditabacterales bacterium]
MRFIKRLVFVIILLLIAFFIYRLINPTAAKQLLFDIKTFSNDKIGTHFSLSGEILIASGVVLDETGIVLEETGALQELTGDEELLLNAAEFSGESLDTTNSTAGTNSKTQTTSSTTSTQTQTQTTTSSSSKKLSDQENRDMKNLLENFGN